MSSKSISSRLQILNDGRSHFLDYLRNLTPAILLLTFALIVGKQLNFDYFDISNFQTTSLFFLLLSSSVLAFYASTTLFYERFFAPLIAWRTALFKALDEKKLNGFQRYKAKYRACWLEKKIEITELAIFMYFFLVCSVLIFVSAWNAAFKI